MKKVICLFVIAILFLNADAQEAVDLGLSVKWSSCNVGAKAPEEFGNYFRWGEVTKDLQDDKEYPDWVDDEYHYLWNYQTYRSWLIKYCTDSSMGPIDNLTSLESTDDAATFCMGEEWRMPTEEEMEELIDCCQWEWIGLRRVAGYKVTGPNGNHIFLPASYYNNPSNGYKDANGCYWTSSLNPAECSDAMVLAFCKGIQRVVSDNRGYAHTIRAVKACDSTKHLTDIERKVIGTYRNPCISGSGVWSLITLHSDYSYSTISFIKDPNMMTWSILETDSGGTWSTKDGKVIMDFDSTCSYEDEDSNYSYTFKNGDLINDNDGDDFSILSISEDLYYPKDYGERRKIAEQTLPFKYKKRQDFIGTWANNHMFNADHDTWTFKENGTATHVCHCNGYKVTNFKWHFNENNTKFGDLIYEHGGLYDLHIDEDQAGYLEKQGNDYNNDVEIKPGTLSTNDKMPTCEQALKIIEDTWDTKLPVSHPLLLALDMKCLEYSVVPDEVCYFVDVCYGRNVIIMPGPNRINVIPTGPHAVAISHSGDTSNWSQVYFSDESDYKAFLKTIKPDDYFFFRPETKENGMYVVGGMSG